MSDAVAVLIFFVFLVACGLGPACNFKGPGLAYEVDGVKHHLLIGHRRP